MRKGLYNLLIFLTVIVSAWTISTLMRSRMPEVDIIEPVETYEVQKDAEAEIKVDEVPQESVKIVETVPPVPVEKTELPENITVAVQTAEDGKHQTSAADDNISEPNVEKITAPAAVESPKVTAVVIPKTEQPAKVGVEKIKSPAVATAKKTAPAGAAAKKVKKEKNIVEYICSWNETFQPDGHENGVKFVDDWKRDGGVLFTPKTKFYLRYDEKAVDNSVLVIESNKSSAVFGCDLSGKVNLNETPVMRWRWRVKKLPPLADGRKLSKDDQAVGIYIGAGTPFNQKAIAYRWETETPVGHWGKIVYSKVMNVWFYCLRNKDNGTDVWYEETRNVRDDFIARYGYVPKNIGIAICGNSQNSKSDALAEIDYIGFYKEVKK